MEVFRPGDCDLRRCFTISLLYCMVLHRTVGVFVFSTERYSICLFLGYACQHPSHDFNGSTEALKSPMLL